MRFVLSACVAAICLVSLGPAAGPAATLPQPSCAAGPTTLGDTTYGTPCDDVIVAAPGVELVRGGAGDDRIVAAPATAAFPFLGVGSQTFEGGPGDDVVYGQRGNDRLRGGEGNDQLFGGIGDDVLDGGPGNDRLAGGFGADAIDGENGDDYVHGDGTIDRIEDSGGGVDTISFASGVTPGFGDGMGAFPGFPGAAEGRGVEFEMGAGGQNADNGVAPFGGGVDEIVGADFEIVIGTPFSDHIVGTAAAQVVFGGGGADAIEGGGGVDTLDGGADGDYLDGGAVVPRDPGKVSVGLMAPGIGSYSQLYLSGSDGADVAAAVWSPTLVAFVLAAGSFDQSGTAAAGCSIPTPTEAVCPLLTPLDSIVLAGMAGDDTLSAIGFPIATTVVLLGGEGADSLNGGEESEDVIVDGPAALGGGGDVLSGLGGDDALLHNAGADLLLGGDGNDLFLSDSVCDGNRIGGGPGRDNASWARFDEGVGANLGSGQAGRPGSGGTPSCAAGNLDSLAEIEDLEGSNFADVFYGDAGPNQLLGHTGPDVYVAGAGQDSILANSADADPLIDCGDDIDRALVDYAEYGDAAPVNCEAVREAAPNSFQLLPDFPLPLPPPPPAPVKKVVRDRKPPRTIVVSHPAARLSTAKPRLQVVFRFSSSERGSRFRCRLDRQPYRACTSPRAYALAPGRHTVRIFAIDRAGNVDRTPAVLPVRVQRR